MINVSGPPAEGRLRLCPRAAARGDRVELRDFGVFAVKRRAARTARNPRNGAAVVVGQKDIPTFKTARNMRRRLNASELA